MKKSVKITKAEWKNKIKKFARFAYIQLGLLMTAVAFPGGVSAAGDPGSDKWDAIIGFILPWISRLGGVVILIGGIEFGLAWKNDNAEKKTQGMRTIIAGCIVTAVGLSSDLFLN